MNGKLITFDLDNTLWDVDAVIVTAENAMRGWLRQHVPEVVTLYENQGIAEIRAKVVAEHPELRHNVSRLRVLIVQRSIETCGYSARDAERLVGDGAVAMDRLTFGGPIQPFLQIREVLGRLVLLSGLNQRKHFFLGHAGGLQQGPVHFTFPEGGTGLLGSGSGVSHKQKQCPSGTGRVNP